LLLPVCYPHAAPSGPVESFTPELDALLNRLEVCPGESASLDGIGLPGEDPLLCLQILIKLLLALCFGKCWHPVLLEIFAQKKGRHISKDRLLIF